MTSAVTHYVLIWCVCVCVCASGRPSDYRASHLANTSLRSLLSYVTMLYTSPMSQSHYVFTCHVCVCVYVCVCVCRIFDT
mmetsp:Transcript_33627/g.49226  ORF Transcript_33627/g.49226 Transcript_33627/m.49226 type:complete len:80 (-) Transcript_33627:417-656(-)